jgi:hypothetical protein
MRVIIEDQLLIDSNNNKEIEQALTEWISLNDERVIVHYECGNEVQEGDWLEFIQANATIDTKIVLVTEKWTVVMRDMKESTQEYCNQVLKNLPSIVEKLYGQQASKQEAELANLFEGLDYLISSANLLSFPDLIQNRQNSVVELSEAYEQKDFIELADLLQYDWLPWIKEYNDTLQKLELEM